MTSAYLLDRMGHHVTVFERQSSLGGHIKTLNKNVTANHAACDRILENGVLEFPTAFQNFINLMQALGVELEPVNIGSALFLKDGSHYLSATAIQKNFMGFQRWIEYLRLDTLYARSAGFWLQIKFSKMQDFYDQSMAQHLKQNCIRNTWLKLLTMYSYSTPLAMIDNFPAELAIPTLRDYVFVDWVRVKHGVYSYIEKIVERFQGEICLNAEITGISRNFDGVVLKRSPDDIRTFDKVVFATPPDQVMKLLEDPTDSEIKRFSAWQPNFVQTVLHRDRSMYDRYGIQQASEFDFFQTSNKWGYNAYLNQLCGISASTQYSLAFQLEELINPEKIIHVQAHHTPLYNVESFHYRDEIVDTNGENHTYHAGAYLGDGLHEGAITSALRVTQLIG